MGAENINHEKTKLKDKEIDIHNEEILNALNTLIKFLIKNMKIDKKSVSLLYNYYI